MVFDWLVQSGPLTVALNNIFVWQIRVLLSLLSFPRRRLQYNHSSKHVQFFFPAPRHPLQTFIMLARATRPKLALAVPTASSTHALQSSPRPISPSPVSPTVKNTRANQRGFSTLQQPTFAYAQSSSTKSILKKGPSTSSSKKLQFCEEPAVRCITPVPEDYHGTYVKLTRDERRWGKGDRERV